MAKRKTFTIEINGIKEAHKSVGKLFEDLNKLDKMLDRISKRKIKIPVELEDSASKITKQLDAIAKKAKVKKMPTEKVGELDDSQAKEYDNTLNGIKKHLKDLKKEIGNIDLDLGQEDFLTLQEEILKLTTSLKEYEAAQGTFSRSVGDYANKVKEGLRELANEAEDSGLSVEELRDKINKLGNEKLDISDLQKYGLSLDTMKKAMAQVEDELNKTSVGTAKYKQLNDELINLRNGYNNLQKMMNKVVKADDQLNTKIQKTIQGQTYVFDNVTQAIGELEDKLYKLAASGQRDTKEFKDFAQVASELKIQLRGVDTAIDAMVEGGAGIHKVLSYTQGFTAIATAYEGIGQLFGRDSEDTMKSVQTMTALSGVMESIRIISDEMSKGTAFGKFISGINTAIDKLIASLIAYKESLLDITKITDKMGKRNPMEQYAGALDLAIFSSDKLRKAYEKLRKEAAAFGIEGETAYDTFRKISDEYTNLLDLKDKGEIVDEDRLKGLESLAEDFANIGLSADATVKRVYGFKDGLKVLKVSLKELGSVIIAPLKGIWELGKNLLYFNKAQRASIGGAISLTGSFKLLAKGATAAKYAIKGLKMALKATIIFALIDAVMTLVQWIGKFITSVDTWIRGNDKLVESFATLEQELNSVTNSIDKYKRSVDRLKDNKFIDELDAEALVLSRLKDEVLKGTLALKEFIKARNNYKPIEENLSDDGLTQVYDFKNIEEFKEKFQLLQKAVISGVDEIEAKGEKGFKNFWKGLFYTKGDAKSDLAVLQKRVIEDIQDKLNNIDLSKGTQEIGKFFNILDDEMYATSLANIENLFPEEEWAKVLAKRIESLRSMYDEMVDLGDENLRHTKEELDRLTNEIVEHDKTLHKKIRDNKTEAIKDDYEREKKILENQRRDELDEAEGNLKLIISINEKYDKQLLDLTEDYGDKLSDVWRIIRDNNLEAEDESLEKRLQKLRNAMADEIEDARRNGIMVNELVLSIQRKYNKLIELEKERHNNDLYEMDKEYADRFAELNKEMGDIELEKKTQDIDIRYNEAQSASEGSFDFDAIYGKRIEEEKRYNKERLNIELDYLEEKKRLEASRITKDYNDEVEEENAAYRDRIDNLKQSHKEGKISLDEYNSYVEREEEAHISKMSNLSDKLNNSLSANESAYYNDRKNKISNALKEEVSLYERYENDIQELMDKGGNKKNIFGVPSVTSLSKNFKKAQSLVKEGLKGIKDEYDKLDEALANNEITYADYKDAKEQLTETEKTIKEKGKDIKKTLMSALGDVATQWKDMITSWVGAVGSLLTTMNDTALILIDNELAHIERQLEIQQEAYDKAEQAAEAHKNKMDGIEDELKEARGARRQFLIDALAEQQKAYLEEVAAKEDAEKEKERLEKKQKKVERKRKEQEKKANIQQAYINTFMAVSNALAVNPWFVGLALSAVAMALGMKNVAAIKSTPIYKDGGVIEGKRHKDGGVKVLGGRAEVEGGEFITNRKATENNLRLLEYINDKKKPLDGRDLINFFNSNTPNRTSKTFFKDGGVLPASVNEEVNKIVRVSDTSEDNATYVVQVVDIINAEENLRKVQTLSGLVSK